MLVPEINGPLSDALQAYSWWIEYLSIHNISKNDIDFNISYLRIDNKLLHGKME